VLGRDWASATIGTEVRIAPKWTGLASFTAQVGQNNVTNYGGLIGFNYASDPEPGPGLIYKN
jgi:outer membrane autotransporter protein